MKKKKWLFFVVPPAILLFIWIGGEVVMQLWNWLLPMLFGWRQITFWQALGLLVLCRILFGGFGCHGHDQGRSWRPRDKCRERMIPEESEKFRQDLRSRSGGAGAAAGEGRDLA